MVFKWFRRGEVRIKTTTLFSSSSTEAWNHESLDLLLSE